MRDYAVILCKSILFCVTNGQTKKIPFSFLDYLSLDVHSIITFQFPVEKVLKTLKIPSEFSRYSQKRHLRT